MLFESRRVPEIIIILKCKEKATFDRIINREAIRAEYNRLMEIRETDKKAKRKEERDEFIAKLEEGEVDVPEEERKT